LKKISENVFQNSLNEKINLEGGKRNRHIKNNIEKLGSQTKKMKKKVCIRCHGVNGPSISCMMRNH
jgi:hypothetical protein